MARRKKVHRIPASKSSWVREVRITENPNILLITGLRRRKTMRDIRAQYPWFTTPEVTQALVSAIDKVESIGKLINEVLVPLQRTPEAKEAIAEFKTQ